MKKEKKKKDIMDVRVSLIGGNLFLRPSRSKSFFNDQFSEEFFILINELASLPTSSSYLRSLEYIGIISAETCLHFSEDSDLI